MKELLVPAEESAARQDAAFQLAAGKAGVRLPRHVTTVEGDVLFDGRWRVHEWMDPLPGEVVAAAELGMVTAGLHEVGHPASGPVAAWFSEPVGRAAGAFAGVLRQACPVP